MTPEEKLKMIEKLVETHLQYAAGMAAVASLKKDEKKQHAWTTTYDVLINIKKALDA